MAHLANRLTLVIRRRTSAAERPPPYHQTHESRELHILKSILAVRQLVLCDIL